MAQIIDWKKSGSNHYAEFGSVQLIVLSTSRSGFKWRTAVVGANGTEGLSSGTAADLIPAKLAAERSAREWHSRPVPARDVPAPLEPQRRYALAQRAALEAAAELHAALWGASSKALVERHVDLATARLQSALDALLKP